MKPWSECLLCNMLTHSGDSSGTAESCQLHQLIHAEAVLTEELLVNVLGLLLPERDKLFRLDQSMCVKSRYGQSISNQS